ncbi:MAG: hypothetical protein AB9M60_08210 [Leptothrix sp. (in: b-proteobacteria)]
MKAELIQAVARSAHLSDAQATLAVEGVLRFLAARLPSPLFGELQSHLQPDPLSPPDLSPGASPR